MSETPAPKNKQAMELNKILKRLMLERDVKATQVSRATGVPVQTLHNWLCGQKPRDIGQVKEVANFLEVSLDFLCFGVEPRGVKELLNQEGWIEGCFEVRIRRRNL